MAIALLEFLGDRAHSTPVQVFATDIGEHAVERARTGVYPENISADVSPERLRRFFTKLDGSYRISKTVRDLCVFARQDLTRDPPFSRLDLILCRNVMIYLGPVLQKRLMTVFHYALKPGGFLMLGNAETVGPYSDLFAAADKKHRLYTRKFQAARTDMEFTASDHAVPDRAAPGRAGNGARKTSASDAPGSGNVQFEANRAILARYAPPGVIVDADFQIVQFRGQTGPYLEPAPGEASLSLLKMAREGMLYALRTALQEARAREAPARKEALRIRQNGRFREVNLEVIPITPANEPRHYLVLFEEAEATRPVERAGAADREEPRGQRKQKQTGKAGRAERKGARRADPTVRRLEAELAASRDYLQSIIQDLEAANEELQSANEEILSSNEELQSTNEELDTAKEELQSTNEELNTLNDELSGRNDELSRVNSDLINLLGSVEIPIVMVSSDLKIRRFTPTAERVLNLIPTDVGRPIGDIKPNVDCPDLERLITEAVDTVSVKERDVTDRQGRMYSLRIRPYKNLDNKIDGAVLALIDVDHSRRHERSAQGSDERAPGAAEARDYAEAVFDTVREPLMVLDSDFKVRRINRAFRRLFRMSGEEAEGRSVYGLMDGHWDTAQVRGLLADVLKTDRIEDFEMDQEFPRIGRRRLRINARRVGSRDGPDRPPLILLALAEET